MSRLRTYALPLLVALCLLLAGCSALAAGGPPELTVENDDDRQYRVTVYAVAGVDDPQAVPFEATTDEGARRSVGFSDVRLATAYRNVTLGDVNATSRWTVVAADGNATLELREWDRGDLLVFVVETADPTRRLTYVAASECDGPAQSNTISLAADGTTSRTASCE